MKHDPAQSDAVFTKTGVVLGLVAYLVVAVIIASVYL
jgi:hypothetical protein